MFYPSLVAYTHMHMHIYIHTQMRTYTFTCLFSPLLLPRVGHASCVDLSLQLFTDSPKPELAALALERVRV